MISARKRVSPGRVLAVILTLCLGGAVLAENVDPAGDGSQYAWSERVGWLNAEPQGEGGPGIQLTDTELTGWIWAGDAGWISLSCQNTSSCGTNDYGVINDGKGNLSGFAWGEHLGWISFRTDGGSDCCTDTGTPGCADSTCEAAICPLDPFCCTNRWDQLCADAALAEASCVDACSEEPAYGVRVHADLGHFAGRAWSERGGWIAFGTSPVAPESWQIETTWRCPDPDLDSICSASDNCASVYNASQEAVPFIPPVSAVTKNTFQWGAPLDWQLVTGTFTSSSDLATWPIDFYVEGSGTSYSDLSADPPGGFAYWYLWRVACAAGSWSTGNPSEQGGRDAALIP